MRNAAQDIALTDAWSWSQYGSGDMPSQYYMSAIEMAWQL